MKLRIAVTTSYGYWQNFAPSDLFEPAGKRMIGGGETAMLWLSRSLADAGHQVDLFYNVARPGRYYGVDFLPKAMKLSMLMATDYDLLVSWEDTEAVSVMHRAGFVVYAAQCNRMDIGVLDYGIDLYQFVSKWHCDTMFATDPIVDADKFFVVPNGVDLRRYEQQPPVEREPFRIIHSSSPDRGLHHLLDIWPRIKKRIPQAELHVYYDMAGWFGSVDTGRQLNLPVVTADLADRVRVGLKATEGMDVVLHGGIGQWDLAREQQKASLLVYPCDPISPTEGFSCTVLEALAAGTPVVTTDADAFHELWSKVTKQLPLPFEGREEQWVDAIVELLTNQAKWQRASERGRKHAQLYRWQDIGPSYVALLEKKVKEKRAVTA